jgi:hypothetical protein
LHVIAGEAPVAFSVEVAQGQLVLQAEFDARRAIGDLAGDEFKAAYGKVMKSEEIIALLAAEMVK